MATTEDAIQRLQIQSSTPGAEEATESLNKLAEAYGGLTVASASTEKATASLDSKFASIERRYIDGVAAQQQYAKIQATVNAAVAQNPALTERANAVLEAAKERYDSLTGSQSSYEKAMDLAKDKASELARELGPLGSALAAIGPIGLAVGAAIGVAVLAMDKLKEQANEAGRWASQLQNTSNIIGANTVELQALEDTAGKVGVSSGDLAAGFERFSVAQAQLRDGSGTLFNALTKFNPALAAQLSLAKDSTTAWNLLAQAYSQADKQQQALIARAAFGRDGAALGGVLQATANAGGIGGLVEENQEDAISNEQIKRWADLTTQIKSATESAEHNFQSIFTTQILENQRNFSEAMLTISRSAKEFALSDDFRTFMQFLTNPIVAGIIGGAAVGGAGGFFMGGVGAGPGALAGGFSGGIAGLITKMIGDAGAASRAAKASEGQPLLTGSEGLKKTDYDPGSDPDNPGSPAFQAAQLQTLVAQLGPAATAQERFNAVVAASKAALDEASKSTDADYIAQQRSIAGRIQANASLELETSLQNARNAALGGAATVSDAYQSKLNSLMRLQQGGAGLTQDEINKQLQLTVAQSSGIASINAMTDAEKVKLATFGMSEEQSLAYAVAQSEINKQLAQGRSLQDINVDGIKAAAAEYAKTAVEANKYADIQKTLQDGAAQFTTDFVQGLLAGQGAMEALGAAATDLGKTLVNSGIKDIIKNPTDATGYIETGIGAIMQLFGASSASDKALQEAKDQWAQMTDQVTKFNLAAKGVDLGPLTNELNSLYSSFTSLVNAAIAAQDNMSAGNLAANFDQSVARIISEFASGTQQLSPLQQQIKGVNDEAAGLKATLEQLNATGWRNYPIDAIDSAAQAQIKALVAQFTDTVTQDLQSRLNTAQGKGYLNDAASLLAQHQTDLANAAELGNDPAMLAQISAVFAAEAQKIVQDAGLVGDQFTDFIKLFPQLGDVVHQATVDVTDSIKTIQQYLEGLQTGSNSILSPQDQLAAAQANFSRQLALAQGGDADALSSITNYASTLLDQAKNFYASSDGYAAIYQAVTAALGALAGVTTFAPSTTTPVTTIVPTAGSSIAAAIASTGAANDNGQYFAQLGQTFIQASGANAQAQIAALQDAVATLGAKLDRIASNTDSSRRGQRPSQKAS